VTDPGKLGAMNLAELDALPAWLADVLARVPAAARLTPATDGSFCLTEHLWHLADLERDGFATRIDRLIAEDDPALPDFDGERVARARCYRELDAAGGLAAFTEARRTNLARLAGLTEAQRGRSGTQDGVGRVVLGDLAQRMRDHDRAHIAEIEALLAQIGLDRAPAL
jgi:hypothetical protein